MKLHRLTLRNYRGIAHRDVEFPDRGVVVVSGANEIGKSSMIEALDLLLGSKDRSTKKDVKQVKPTHVDEGAEVTAEISSGPYRFTYHKRFHKKPVTALTITAPTREQLTGDEAHERVEAILAQTVDVRLWEAQRVLQASSTAPVDLSGSDALSRALDVAAGQSAPPAGGELSGSEPLLIDRIDEEFRRYFTATGRPTGEWLAARKRRESAAEDVAACRARVAEVEDAVARHEATTAELAVVVADRAAATARVDRARAASDAVAQVAGRLHHARQLADAARSTHEAALAAAAERTRLCADVDRETRAIADLETALGLAVAEHDAARLAHESAAAAATAATTDVEAARQRVDAARVVVEQTARRAEADRLRARLEKIDAAAGGLRDADAQLAQNPVTERAMRQLEKAAAAVDVAAAAAEAASARIEVLAHAPLAVSVDGVPVPLAAGQAWSAGATSPTEVALPGVATVRVVPGTPAADTGAVLAAARTALAQALTAAGVDDVDAARELDAQRREVTSLRQRLQAARDALLGDDDLDALRRRSATLDAELPDDTSDPEEARVALEESVAAHGAARAAATALRDAAAAAATTMTERATRATTLREGIDTARARVAAIAERLHTSRAAVADDVLRERAAAAADRTAAAAATVESLAAELAAAEPAAVAAELAAATAVADDLARRHDDLSDRLVATTAQLEVYGTEGRRGRLDAALAEHAHAESDFVRLQRRANAVMLLRSTMTRHRDDARKRYVDPFRVEVERLGRLVFGADFHVEVDAELTIRSRTLDGCTVPYESLSGGAKEQLGIVARLAGAALVAKEDGVPVVIDDALGFTDAGRLAKMAGVFDAVGGDGQVIVLTCSPERYAGVAAAHRIELSA